MWLLSKVTSSPAGKYREPRQAEVMEPAAFRMLVESQPWKSVEFFDDGWYQYAVVERDADNGKGGGFLSYRILNGAGSAQGVESAAWAGVCALAVMAKAPRPGRVKTRLAPALGFEGSAAINICFLRDTAANIAGVVAATAGEAAAGVVSYTPVGDEAAFDGLLPEDFVLVPQRGDAFGERLLAAAEDILACGFGSVWPDRFGFADDAGGGAGGGGRGVACAGRSHCAGGHRMMAATT